MEHVDSDFAPIRKSQKIVDSDKIVRAINDDLEQKNFTILRKLSLVPIRGSAKSSKVSKPGLVKRRVDHAFYQDFKPMALNELGAGYSSVSYVSGLRSFLMNDFGKMEDQIVFFNRIKHIHQYVGIDNEVSNILSLVNLNVVIIDMNDYLTKGIFSLDKLRGYVSTDGKRRYKAHLDFKVDENAPEDPFDLIMRKVGQCPSVNNILCFKFEHLDGSSSSDVVMLSKLAKFTKALLLLKKIKNIAFKFLVYSNNINISSLLSTTLEKKLSAKPIIFELPILTAAQVEGRLKKIIKFTSDFGSELAQSYNSFIRHLLNDKNSNLARFFEFLQDFPHPFTYLFNVYTEILVQSKSFDELLDRITNKLTVHNYPHCAYNFKKNQRLPLKATRRVHDI